MTHTFLRQMPPEPPTCGQSAWVDQRCQWTQTYVQCHQMDATIHGCQLDGIKSLVHDKGSLLVAAQQQVMMVKDDLSEATVTATMMPWLGSAVMIQFMDQDRLIVCGEGRDRQICGLLEQKNLSLVGQPWLATGLIAERGGLTQAVVVQNTMYSALNRKGKVLPDRNSPDQVKISAASNVVVRAPILPDEEQWVSEYPTAADKGRIIMISGDRPWLVQPQGDSVEFEPIISWTSGEYVYFAFNEAVSKGSDSSVARVARVCINEFPLDPTESAPFLTSFVKLNTRCIPELVSTEPTVITAVAVTPGPEGTVFMAFRTPAGTTGDDITTAVCSFPYGGPGTIDFEMNGFIDFSDENQVDAILYGTGSMRPFTCNRTLREAERLFWVNPAHQTANRTGEASADTAIIVSRGVKSPIVDLLEVEPVYGGFTILWAVDSAGYLSKRVVDETISSKVIETVKLREQAVDLAIDDDRNLVFVATSRGVFQWPTQHCHEHFTCAQCIGSGDPHCGWCPSSYSCSVHSQCNSTNGRWMQVNGTTMATHCAAPPRDLVLSLTTADASLAIFSLVDDGLVASEYSRPCK